MVMDSWEVNISFIFSIHFFLLSFILNNYSLSICYEPGTVVGFGDKSNETDIISIFKKLTSSSRNR